MDLSSGSPATLFISTVVAFIGGILSRPLPGASILCPPCREFYGVDSSLASAVDTPNWNFGLSRLTGAACIIGCGCVALVLRRNRRSQRRGLVESIVPFRSILSPASSTTASLLDAFRRPRSVTASESSGSTVIASVPRPYVPKSRRYGPRDG